MIRGSEYRAYGKFRIQESKRIMRTSDDHIHQDVLDQIKWNPLLTASEIGVSVKNGIVTLSGQVDTYYKKIEAEKEARKVKGVRGIAQDIHVGASPGFHRTDNEIALALINALQWHTSIPNENIWVKVDSGFVTLEGTVEWRYQRESAWKAASQLAGVRYLVNNIKVAPKIKPADLKEKIQAAFVRSATIDAGKIEVQVMGTTVMLKGKVKSLAEKADAENAAWSAPGVLLVDNEIEVELEEKPGMVIPID